MNTLGRRLVRCAVLALATATAAAAPPRPHILLILVDDLKPALGCYGDPAAVTPNMDRLASQGMRFEPAFCRQAVCAPSRFHRMLGAYSTTTGLYGLGDADGRIADEATRRIEAAAERARRDGTPAFLAIGFVRPHLPFSVPQRYWDPVDPARLPRPSLRTLLRGAPAIAGKKGGDIANYEPVGPNGTIAPKVERPLIHGYYAAVAYVDAQIGRILDALERAGLAPNTIVVSWGDNGFHLGDHGLRTKHTNYEQATRIPLIIAGPGVGSPGSATRQPAGRVDIFPTLCDLAGLPPPRGPPAPDGLSLLPVLRDPGVRVRDHVLHVYSRGKILGRAVRTERYRLVEWMRFGDDDACAEIGLYDYEADPQETVNLAAERPELVARLRAILAAAPVRVPP